MQKDHEIRTVVLLCVFLFGLMVICYDCAVTMLFLMLSFLFLYFFVNMLIICYKDCFDVALDSESDSDDVEDMMETEVAIVVKQENISIVE